MNISKLHLRLTKLTTKYILNNPINHNCNIVLSNSKALMGILNNNLQAVNTNI